MGLNVRGEVEERLRQPAPLNEKERDQEPTQPAIPVQKRMNRFKLLVHHRALDKIGECIPFVKKSFPISQQVVHIFR